MVKKSLWTISLAVVSVTFTVIIVAVANPCREGSYPHDPKAFTQGLLFHSGVLYESIGRYGHSAVRKIDLATGQILVSRALPPDHFGEGLALQDGILYQLTWHNKVVWKYDPVTLEPLGSIPLQGEAWGLASNGREMVMSDGSAILSYVDPKDFREIRRLTVKNENGTVRGLNELEFAAGLLLANVYPTNRLLIIDPLDGRVLDELDLTPFALDAAAKRRVDVANGIAYIPEHLCLLVTGKYWPRIYRLPFPERFRQKRNSG